MEGSRNFEEIQGFGRDPQGFGVGIQGLWGDLRGWRDLRGSEESRGWESNAKNKELLWKVLKEKILLKKIEK